MNAVGAESYQESFGFDQSTLDLGLWTAEQLTEWAEALGCRDETISALENATGKALSALAPTVDAWVGAFKGLNKADVGLLVDEWAALTQLRSLLAAQSPATKADDSETADTISGTEIRSLLHSEGGVRRLQERFNEHHLNDLDGFDGDDQQVTMRDKDGFIDATGGCLPPNVGKSPGANEDMGAATRGAQQSAGWDTGSDISDATASQHDELDGPTCIPGDLDDQLASSTSSSSSSEEEFSAPKMGSLTGPSPSEKKKAEDDEFDAILDNAMETQHRRDVLRSVKEKAVIHRQETEAKQQQDGGESAPSQPLSEIMQQEFKELRDELGMTK